MYDFMRPQFHHAYTLTQILEVTLKSVPFSICDVVPAAIYKESFAEN